MHFRVELFSIEANRHTLSAFREPLLSPSLWQWSDRSFFVGLVSDSIGSVCSRCGSAISAVIEKAVLCDHCYTHEADQMTEAERKEQELFDPDPEAPDPILIEGFQPTLECLPKCFFPFSDSEAIEMARHLEQTQETWGSLSSTAVECALRIHDQLLLYRGRTWFTPGRWTFFQGIMEVIGWPPSLNRADIQVPDNEAD